MNNDSNLFIGKSKKTWGLLFIGILSIQAILELVVGANLLFNFPFALESGFGITYSKELDILGIALGLYLLLLSALLILSSIWTYRANPSGIVIGIISGVFLMTFGVVASVKSGDMQAILIDGIRGLITIVLGYMAGKELKK